jgi:hypothetical protein
MLSTDDLRTVLTNLTIEIVTAVSPAEDETDTPEMLQKVAAGLRRSAEAFASGEVSELMNALADGIEPLETP